MARLSSSWQKQTPVLVECDGQGRRLCICW